MNGNQKVGELQDPESSGLSGVDGEAACRRSIQVCVQHHQQRADRTWKDDKRTEA